MKLRERERRGEAEFGVQSTFHSCVGYFCCVHVFCYDGVQLFPVQVEITFISSNKLHEGEDAQMTLGMSTFLTKF